MLISHMEAHLAAALIASILAGCTTPQVGASPDDCAACIAQTTTTTEAP
jgi:hypothetical protein